MKTSKWVKTWKVWSFSTLAGKRGKETTSHRRKFDPNEVLEKRLVGTFFCLWFIGRWRLTKAKEKYCFREIINLSGGDDPFCERGPWKLKKEIVVFALFQKARLEKRETVFMSCLMQTSSPGLRFFHFRSFPFYLFPWWGNIFFLPGAIFPVLKTTTPQSWRPL